MRQSALCPAATRVIQKFVPESDRNLLFCMLALQCGFITRDRFVDACALWIARRDIGVDQILVEQGWMTQAARTQVEALLNARGALQRAPSDPLNEDPLDERDTVDYHQAGRNAAEADRQPLELLRAIGASRIELRTLHSSGGIGEVWIANDVVLGRQIAVKKLRDDKATAPVHRERFLREAKLTAQLDHPGIVPVYDYFANDESGLCCYIMRFVNGRTLTEVIRSYHDQRTRDGRAAATGAFIQLLGYFLRVCNTVAFAHSRRVIHRDLKGDNIIIGDFDEVLVLDWGLAKQLPEEVSASHSKPREEDISLVATLPTGGRASSQTLQGEQLGTPSFMAPEQAAGLVDEIDYRTDVYGLSALFYEILVGEPPFRGPSIANVMRRVLDEPPTAPNQIVGGVPPELEAACLKGLAKSKDQRFQSVAELANAVQSWLSKRAERMRSQEERERFFQLSLDLLAILEPGDRIIQANFAWEAVLGINADALHHTTFERIVDERDRTLVFESLQRLWCDEPHVEFEVRCSQAAGGYRWIHWNAKMIPDERAIYLVGRDVTDRKLSEQTFRGLLESAPDATCVVDSAGTIVLINSQMERLFGYASGELLGQDVGVLLPEEARPRHSRHVAAFVAAPEQRPMGSGLELSGRHKDGSTFAAEVSLSPVKTEAGMLISCAIRDLSARHKAGRLIQAILDSAPDAMLTIDKDGILRQANRQVEAIFGYPRVDLIGKSMTMLLANGFDSLYAAYFAEDIEDGVQEVDAQRVQRAPTLPPNDRPSSAQPGIGHRHVGRHKSGRDLPLMIRLSPVETTDELFVCASIQLEDTGPQGESNL